MAALCALALTLLASRVCRAEVEWNPAAWENLDTLEMLTVGPEEGKHWSKLWLVVIDGRVCLRLGSRVTSRLRRNTTGARVSVRVGGRRFNGVYVRHAPELRDRVAAGMSEKYWSDFFVRVVPHPMTVCLTPAANPTESQGAGKSASVHSPGGLVSGQR